MNIYKNSAIAIAGILAAVATLILLVVNITPLLVAAYVFTIFAIGVLLWVNLFFINNARTYPWGAVIPQTAVTYLRAEFTVSLAAVLLERLANIELPARWFVVIQAIIIAFFAIRLIFLNAGRVEIERVGRSIPSSARDWKLLTASLETLAARSPDIKPLFDAARYSDPVTNPAIAEYDVKIRDAVSTLAFAVDNGDAAKISELIPSLFRQIEDRNRYAKLSKNN